MNRLDILVIAIQLVAWQVNCFVLSTQARMQTLVSTLLNVAVIWWIWRIRRKAMASK